MIKEFLKSEFLGVRLGKLFFLPQAKGQNNYHLDWDW